MSSDRTQPDEQLMKRLLLLLLPLRYVRTHTLSIYGTPWMQVDRSASIDTRTHPRSEPISRSVSQPATETEDESFDGEEDLNINRS